MTNQTKSKTKTKIPSSKLPMGIVHIAVMGWTVTGLEDFPFHSIGYVHQLFVVRDQEYNIKHVNVIFADPKKARPEWETISVKEGDIVYLDSNNRLKVFTPNQKEPV